MEEKILLVEDEEKLARMVELELRYEGYQVHKSFDGRSGLERALSGEYDLVLLDIMLPQLSGMEVLRRLRRDSSPSSCSPPGTAWWTRYPAWTPGRTTISPSPSPSRSCWPASGRPCGSGGAESGRRSRCCPPVP